MKKNIIESLIDDYTAKKASSDKPKTKEEIKEEKREAKEEDIAIAGGIGEGLLIKKGEIVRKVKEEELLETLRQELLNWNR